MLVCLIRFYSESFFAKYTPKSMIKMPQISSKLSFSLSIKKPRVAAITGAISSSKNEVWESSLPKMKLKKPCPTSCPKNTISATMPHSRMLRGISKPSTHHATINSAKVAPSVLYAIISSVP